MQCQSFELGKKCEAIAVVEVFWPGKRTIACTRHAEAIRRVADAMGFNLEVRSLIAPAQGTEPMA